MKMKPFSSKLTESNLKKLKMLAAKKGAKLYQVLNDLIKKA